MLDRYISGSVARVSPEAPVPIVKVNSEWSTLGGAGNVAINVASIGGTPQLIGLVGKDLEGNEIEEIGKKNGVGLSLIKTHQPTITKSRVISGQQIVRVDREEHLNWSDEQKKQFIGELEKFVPACEIILLSDYAKGTLSDEIIKLVMVQATKHDKRVLVDPKRSDWTLYEGAYAICPNLNELNLALKTTQIENDDNKVVSAARNLLDNHQIENILCTRSGKGMTLVSGSKLLNIPTRAQEVYDVSGAGDTVLATLGVMLAEGNTLAESAFAANEAAGIVVSKLGTATVKRSELNEFLKNGSKLISRNELKIFNRENRKGKVVFTNGCFDVLHQGHRDLLKSAKTMGDILIVGINSDDSISRLKGKDRPINTEKERVEVLSTLPWVDHIVVFSEDTPYELLAELRPELLIKGGDYRPEEIVGREHADRVHIFETLEGFSTTGLLDGISKQK